MNLLEFDTIILDLDFTIWRGCEPEFWARKLITPLKISERRIFDKYNNFIELDKNVDYVLNCLYKNKKQIGFITLGGDLNTKDGDQLVTHCLKMFGIYNYFNYSNHILYKTDLKSNFIKPNKKTIFIDDSYKNLIDVKTKYNEIHTLNRYDFENWLELI